MAVAEVLFTTAKVLKARLKRSSTLPSFVEQASARSFGFYNKVLLGHAHLVMPIDESCLFRHVLKISGPLSTNSPAVIGGRSESYTGGAAIPDAIPPGAFCGA
jgi:hypothetical protein